MPIPIIAAVAAAAGSAIVAGGGVGVYFSSKYKKQIAGLQDEIRRLQVELQKSNDREKELINKIIELEKEKLDLVSKIEKLTSENKANIEKMFSFENSLSYNDTIFRKIIATLTFKLNILKKDNELLKEQISYLTDLVECNKVESQKMNEKIVEIESIRQQSIEHLKSVQTEIEDKKCIIQDMEDEVRSLAK